jgi:hypothetical protein
LVKRRQHAPGRPDGRRSPSCRRGSARSGSDRHSRSGKHSRRSGACHRPKPPPSRSHLPERLLDERILACAWAEPTRRPGPLRIALPAGLPGYRSRLSRCDNGTGGAGKQQAQEERKPLIHRRPIWHVHSGCTSIPGALPAGGRFHPGGTLAQRRNQPPGGWATEKRGHGEAGPPVVRPVLSQSRSIPVHRRISVIIDNGSCWHGEDESDRNDWFWR